MIFGCSPLFQHPARVLRACLVETEGLSEKETEMSGVLAWSKRHLNWTCAFLMVLSVPAYLLATVLILLIPKFPFQSTVVTSLLGGFWIPPLFIWVGFRNFKQARDRKRPARVYYGPKNQP